MSGISSSGLRLKRIFVRIPDTSEHRRGGGIALRNMTMSLDVARITEEEPR